MTICLQPFLLRIHSFCSKLGEDKTEAEVVVAVVRRVVVTIRRATVPRVVVPAAATIHAVCPTLRLSPLCCQTTAAEILAYSMLCERHQRDHVLAILSLSPFSLKEQFVVYNQLTTESALASS